MADNSPTTPSIDQGALMHSRGIGSGGAPPSANDEPEDLFDFINKILEKTGGWITKFTGVNVDSLLKTGVTASIANIEKGGIQVNNQIMHQSIIPNAQGGVLAKLASQIGPTGKNLDFSKISPSSGGDSGGGGGGGGEYSGGGSGGGFSDYSALTAPSSQSFDFTHIPMAMLGEFTPPPTPSGGGRSAGIEMT